MKKAAEQEVKDLIRRFRNVCDLVEDCPIKKAREPSQNDCVVCVLKDVAVMADELRHMRMMSVMVTEYGSTICKLEALQDSTLLPTLKKQIRNGGK